MSVARGEHRPAKGEPRVWFTSMESFARILSDSNRALLDLIAQSQPASLTELAVSSGRAKSNLSRTLKTMERYGLVRLDKSKRRQIVPRVYYSAIVLDVPIVTAGSKPLAAACS